MTVIVPIGVPGGEAVLKLQDVPQDIAIDEMLWVVDGVVATTDHVSL